LGRTWGKFGAKKFVVTWRQRFAALFENSVNANEMIQFGIERAFNDSRLG
jgi:hypothetical protein